MDTFSSFLRLLSSSDYMQKTSLDNMQTIKFETIKKNWNILVFILVNDDFLKGYISGKVFWMGPYKPSSGVIAGMVR